VLGFFDELNRGLRSRQRDNPATQSRGQLDVLCGYTGGKAWVRSTEITAILIQHSRLTIDVFIVPMAVVSDEIGCLPVM